MNKVQFLKLIDELLELDEGTLMGNEELESVGWSSLAVIGFMALADEQFGVAVSPALVSRCKTADNLAALLGDKIIEFEPA